MQQDYSEALRPADLGGHEVGLGTSKLVRGNCWAETKKADYARRCPRWELLPTRVQLPAPPRAFGLPRTERCWRWPALVSEKDFPRPRHRVVDPDAARLRANPQFEVFAPVIVLQAVAVVYGLVPGKETPQHFLHDHYVFEDVAAAGAPRMPGYPKHDVSGLVVDASTLPVAVGLAGVEAARAANHRFRLLRATARALAAGSARGTPLVSAGRLECATAFGARPAGVHF